MKKKMKNYQVAMAVGAAVLLTAACGQKGAAEATTVAESTTIQETTEQETTTQETTAQESSSHTYSAYDADGTEHIQTIDEVPQKVITNNQAGTELLLKLGLGSSIIATVEKDNPTTEDLAEAYDAIPVLSDKRDISKEKIVGMEPDIVIGRVKSFTAETLGSVSDLNDMGIAVYTQESTRMDQEITVESIMSDIKNIGEIFQIEDKANEMADEYEARLKAIEERMSAVEGDSLKVLLMVNYQDGTFGGYGNNASLQKDILNRLHAVNVLDKGGSGMSAENLISLDPDVIVYVMGTKNAEADKVAVESMLNYDVIQSVKAIQNKRVITVEYNDLMGGGYRTFDCMEALEDFFYPEG